MRSPSAEVEGCEVRMLSLTNRSRQPSTPTIRILFVQSLRFGTIATQQFSDARFRR
jgi:hypothetical protein